MNEIQEHLRSALEALQDFNANQDGDAETAFSVARVASQTLTNTLVTKDNWRQAEGIYQEIKALSKRFPRHVLLGIDLIKLLELLIGINISLKQEALAEQKYQELKDIHVSHPTYLSQDTALSKVIPVLIKHYIFVNNWKQVDYLYTDLNMIWRHDPRNAIVSFEYAKVISNLINIQIFNDSKSSKIDQLFNDLTILNRVFYSDPISSYVWHVAKGMTSIVLYYMGLNQRKQAEQAFKELQFVTIEVEHPSKNFISLNTSRLEQYMTVPQNWGIFKEETLMNWERTNKLCEDIYEKFGTILDIIQTDKEFYSDETHLRTIQEKKYFISAESPETTSLITSYLLQQNKLRYKLMHSSRTQKATQTSQSLAEQIENIKKEYSATHSGKDPSLHKLASILTERQIVSPGGKTSWHAKTVQRIIDPSDKSSRNK